MKNKYSILIIVTLLLSLQATFSQKLPFFKNYDWDKTPNYKIEKESNKKMVAIKEKIVTEFYFEENSLIEYFLEHKVLWLNSDEKIEDYNKIYLPYSSTSNLEVHKARVVTKEGEVINLDQSKILTANDEETGKKYKYFAFEGIEKGSFIEFIYVVKKTPVYSGRKINLQSSYDKKVVEFDLFSPKNLIFKFKSYNNLPSIVEDTIIKEKNNWKLHLKEIKGIEKENLSAYNASKGAIVYKLDKNTATKVSDITSYNRVSQNLYAFYYPEYKKKTVQLLNKFITDLSLENVKDEESVVRKLDYYIKTNLFISNEADKNLKDLNEILVKRVMNETGALKLYISLLRTLKIKHELVITSDRREVKFDENFEANNFLTDFLIYFPRTKLYLSPNDFESRFGFPAAYKTDNYGLFVKEVKIGEFKSAVGKIKYIKPVKSDKTFDSMFVNVDFEEGDLLKNNIQLDRSFNGYYAMDIQPFIHLIKGEKRDELIDGLAKSINKNIEIKSKKLVNDKPELFGVKPLQFIVNFSSEAFVEKAGRKYLFKLGELIGMQMQLYQEKERVLSLEEKFQRSYFRTINVNIPKGYKITNLEDLNINNSYSENGKEFFSFKSSFKLIDNKLKIIANEHYRKNIISVSQYEEYRKVINSAADFNKIVLLLELDLK
ncbi:DUF3857 domain-containing protein [uncultured Tenacibaculum sp.]|uniref:DUF3857 domain-containing protein n=1 Tax=uncultured Tenacibaculum sp. TaxID=174713 RepID=UPI002610B787|nr:DUF3857 domain-containing protein [uncultured Tenacibaculum sp.]